MAGNLLWAEIISPSGRDRLNAQEMGYGYRTSVLKRGEASGIILSAEMRLDISNKESVQAKMREYTERRKSSQPPGASMGSMFKNPEGDFAGRLIEAAGLKGTRIGNAEISTVHANFFINYGETKAADVKTLIELTQKTVAEKFGVDLELEIEMIGEWQDDCSQ